MRSGGTLSHMLGIIGAYSAINKFNTEDAEGAEDTEGFNISRSVAQSSC